MSMDYDPPIYKRAEAELLPGERLLWVGQPVKTRRAMFGGGKAGNKAAVLAVVLGLQIMLILGGGVFMMTSSGDTAAGTTTTTPAGTPWIAITIAGFMVLVAVMLAVLSFWRVAARAKNTLYAITDRRALLISGSSVQSYGERDIQFVERKMHRDGTGDVLFRREARSGMTYYGGSIFGSRLYPTEIGFLGIENPQAVETLMLETFRPETGAYLEKPKREETEEEDYFYDEDEEKRARLSR